MIFHEIYGCYYRAVAKIVRAALDGALSFDKMKQIADDAAFGESFLTIIPALKEQKWQLVTQDLHTPLQHPPTMPVTELEKRWLKAITLDPRFKLFGIKPQGLDDVVPLFTPDDYSVFDRYADGDPYRDENYISRFQTILYAIKQKQALGIRYVSRKGKTKNITCLPTGLEYSEKDDKFRLKVAGRWGSTINLQRIEKCQMIQSMPKASAPYKEAPQQSITLLLKDERNTLERAMMHFAHFQKEAEKLDEAHYRVVIRYEQDDETELLIRILSFGPTIKVTNPQRFVDLIKERLIKQLDCGLKL